jgi:hypothetical protein
MALTTSLLSEHRRALAQVARLTERDLTRLWRTLPLSDAATTTVALVDSLPIITDTYGEVAATLAADLYDEARSHPGTYRARTAPPAPLGQVEALARWAVTPLWSDAPDLLAAFGRLRGGTERLVLQPARRTIEDSARNDPVRTGYARHPNPGACDFCLMLASRGAVYATREAALTVGTGRIRGTQQAGEPFHDSCRCTHVPVFAPDDLPDLNRQLQAIWQDTRGSNDDKRAALVAFFGGAN